MALAAQAAGARDVNNARMELFDRIADPIVEHANEHPKIIIEYFIFDEKKAGCRYVTLSGNFIRIDEYNHNMVFVSGEEIPLNDIFEIEI